MTLVSGNISLGKIFGRLDQLPITFFSSIDRSSCFFTLFLYPEAFLKPSRAFLEPSGASRFFIKDAQTDSLSRARVE